MMSVGSYFYSVSQGGCDDVLTINSIHIYIQYMLWIGTIQICLHYKWGWSCRNTFIFSCIYHIYNLATSQPCRNTVSAEVMTSWHETLEIIGHRLVDVPAVLVPNWNIWNMLVVLCCFENSWKWLISSLSDWDMLYWNKEIKVNRLFLFCWVWFCILVITMWMCLRRLYFTSTVCFLRSSKRCEIWNLKS